MRRIAIVCLTLAVALASSCEKISTEFGRMKIKVTESKFTSITVDVTAELPADAVNYYVECYLATEDPLQLYQDYYIINGQPVGENPYLLQIHITEGLPGTHKYTFEIDGLEPRNDYKMRVLVESPNGYSTWGKLAMVSTNMSERPKVTVSTSEVGATYFLATYEIEDIGLEILDEGFYCSDNRRDLEKKKSRMEEYFNGDVVSGLKVNTDYYIQAYAKTTSGWVYSEIMTVRTRKFVDLSEEETANCYIVSRPNRYGFKACRATENEALQGAQAKVLWETVNSYTAPERGSIISDVDYDKESGFIDFEFTGTPGNAVIALYNDKGKIAWSWHIWSTEQPRDQVYSNNAGTMMDRNLGALSTSKEGILSRGLLYQWGRKDPLMGDLSSTNPWFGGVDGPLDHQYAVENPIAKVLVSGRDWCSDGNTDSRWSAVEKTVDDPCPPGYHIPSSSVWSTNLKNDKFTISDSNEWTDGYDFATGSCKFGTYVKSIWYPVTGMISDNSISYTFKKNAYYWADSADGNYVGAFLIMSSSQIKVTKTNDDLGQAIAVRCQKK